MRIFIKRSIYTLCGLAVFLLVGSAFGAAGSPSVSLLPKDLVMEKKFKRGLGLPVGRVLLVQGRVVIMHADMKKGYWAKKKFPLFKGDTIVTQKRGRIRFSLNDGSILTMGSRTKMVINRSVYNEKKKSRSSFLSMAFGKARFKVRKLFGFRRSLFKVKTPTTVAGVRGSDWIMRTTLKLTEVIALEDTKLEVMSVDFPDVKPTLLTDLERTIVAAGALPTEVERVELEEIEQIKKEFVVTPEVIEPEEKVEKRERKKEEKEAEKETPKKPAEGEGVLVSDDELAKPEDTTTSEDLEDIGKPEVDEDVETSDQEEKFEEQKEKAEEIIIKKLPQFPGSPE
ncbi:MAG: FecR domain-containing protein [Desulfobacteraceae bacterium]|nr:FecR domain-containing protein [Desulfobacteraceae bacterium]